MNEAIDSFYVHASLFMEYCTTTKHFLPEDARKLLLMIVDLYRLALCLPECDYDEEYESVLDGPVPIALRFGEYDSYWEFYDPKELDEPVAGSLYDDVFSIFNDLRNGINLYEQNRKNAACESWKIGFDTHWRNHAADAMRALNYIEQ